MNSLIYVEKRLIVPIGVKLIGSSLSQNEKLSGKTGFNWFVQASLEQSTEQTKEMKIAELFPEDIFHSLYEKIPSKAVSIQQLCQNISSHTLKSADVVSIIGTLKIPDVTIPQYNPFKPPKIEIPETYKVYGEECFSGELEMDGFRFPIFFLLDSKEIVCYAKDKPVEIIGVLKWSPSYEVSGYAINQTLLAAALLLRR